MDLAYFPVEDRDLATKELLLRSLYVSLRVAVEIPPGTESHDLDTKLKDMEAHRGDRRDGRDRGARFSIGERLRESKRLVVLGDPGAGKSTMLRWIATAYLLRLKSDPDWNQLPDVGTLPDADWLPLLIRCRDIEAGRGVGPLEEIVRDQLRASQFSDHEARSLTDTLLDALRAGRVLLLIDGLDEISDPGLRARFCQQIDQIHVAYPKASIIVTSRIVGYKEMGLRITRGFEHVTVLDLTPEDKDDFARRWCTVTEPMLRRESAAQQLISDIHSTDRIERLTGNPMLLTTMALVKKKVGKLPSRRADLYREAVEVLLNWRGSVSERLDRYEALPQLQYLAYSMCDAGVQQIREDEVVDTLDRMRQDFPMVRPAGRRPPLEFLRLLERNTGILVESGRTRHNGELVAVYEFRHLTFQEYLAGLALVAGKYPGKDREKPLAGQVATLAARTTPAPNSQHEGDSTVTESWREALRLCVMSCNDDDVDDVLQAVLLPLDGEDMGTSRPRAVLACSCLSDEPNVSEGVAMDIIDRFIGELTDLDGGGLTSTTADAAAEEIAGSNWGPKLSRRIVTAWLKSPEEFWRTAGVAATMLGTAAPRNPVEREGWVRDQTARLDGPQVEAAVEAALALMQAAFIEGIPMVPGLVSRLTSMLSRGPCEAMAAAWVLGWLAKGSPHSMDRRRWEHSADALDELAQAILTDDIPGEAVGFLLWCLDAEVEGRHHTLVAKVIQRYVSSAPRVRGLISDEYPRIFPDAVDPVVAILQHDDEDVRRAAALLLTRMRNPLVVVPLLRLLPDADEDLQHQVVQALGRLGDRRAVEPLLAILTVSDGQPRTGVPSALGQLGDPSAVEPLLSLLTNPDGEPQPEVVQALGQLGDPKAIGPLLELQRVQPLEPPSTMIAALAALGDAEAGQVIRQAMEGDSSETRSAALWSLASLETSRTAKVLLSRDRDGVSPGIDPADELTEQDLLASCAAVDLPLEEVRAHYEELSERYPLRLSWASAERS
ncbi:HEAT repeat domain-containing protein [Streptomyces sp. NPDC002845]